MARKHSSHTTTDKTSQNSNNPHNNDIHIKDIHNNIHNYIHNTVLKPAELWRRLAALVYDWLVLGAVSIGYGAFALWVKTQVFHYELQPGEKADLGLPGFIGWVVVVSAFYSFFWIRGGQTLGMRAWRLQLINHVSQSTTQTAPLKAPSVVQCLARCLIAPFSLCLLGIGYWWSLTNPSGRSLHDIASRTQVIVLPKSMVLPKSKK
ncbi:RDD family protein [Marinibactrum halimedae]|uniref:RDD family protein n=1 Tax=Marinibactrum halimedae TaxID=1444977 RepID=A0AA37TA61_9GAMM|nr:RDD family protein [Marinibactrum halimedae]MCD9457954.1 RDD family protein [Marinibactrum halimedae]GLS26215.1 RDD family protein [Marinibactrum halimedae]